ncbi:MAG: hypothetical protein WBA57_00365 [Elainellaceae cyanobacterium]
MLTKALSSRLLLLVAISNLHKSATVHVPGNSPIIHIEHHDDSRIRA